LRGVGLSSATKEIQIDRYSKIGEGASIDFLDTLDRFKGWKTIFNSPNSWVQYNSVDFGKKQLKDVSVRVSSESGGSLLIHSGTINGPVIAEIKIPKGTDWKNVKTSVKKFMPGVRHLFIESKDGGAVEVDWIKFE
jgi:hypothetical protein